MYKRLSEAIHRHFESREKRLRSVEEICNRKVTDLKAVAA